ncbi:CLUMA_CG012358, isoform A [Clunio marinus]|uniref:CLUMA_CG012358, isoform A n=1 Tax=Clunio marinus TaxID=568069 RepID=A0A1J1IIG0_9DIPT|nr:CLUMA_CG012358, isoform A [Clunio marinus]
MKFMFELGKQRALKQTTKTKLNKLMYLLTCEDILLPHNHYDNNEKKEPQFCSFSYSVINRLPFIPDVKSRLLVKAL